MKNGQEKWKKFSLNSSPLTLNPESTLFSFFALIFKKYKYFIRSGSRIKELNG
jgi:hypothetical protein